MILKCTKVVWPLIARYSSEVSRNSVNFLGSYTQTSVMPCHNSVFLYKIREVLPTNEEKARHSRGRNGWPWAIDWSFSVELHCTRVWVTRWIRCVNQYINFMFFWVVTPCSVGVRYRRFGGSCCLHLQVHTASQPRQPRLETSPL
jgi:hypothetical protein